MKSIDRLFQLGRLEFDYIPFPIGFGRDVVDANTYRQMIASWPSKELFRYMPELGHKHSLSERNHPEKYAELIRSVPIWQEVWQEVKNREFIQYVVECLKSHAIDLGIDLFLSQRSSSMRELIDRICKCKRPRLSSRFEFSMMPNNNGCIKPHTDSPGKLITLVYSVASPGEWQPEWGGGTDVLQVNDKQLSFNHVNRQAEFAQTEVLKTFEFVPNQLVLFIKTFNSWHGVRPMQGHQPAVMRKTLTINIELS